MLISNQQNHTVCWLEERMLQKQISGPRKKTNKQKMLVVFSGREQRLQISVQCLLLQFLCPDRKDQNTDGNQNCLFIYKKKQQQNNRGTLVHV